MHAMQQQAAAKRRHSHSTSRSAKARERHHESAAPNDSTARRHERCDAGEKHVCRTNNEHWRSQLCRPDKEHQIGRRLHAEAQPQRRSARLRVQVRMAQPQQHAKSSAVGGAAASACTGVLLVPFASRFRLSKGPTDTHGATSATEHKQRY